MFSSKRTEYNAFKFIVGIVTRRRAGRSGFRIPVGAGNFYILHQGLDRLWGPPRLILTF
jgi:hypothetical protein